jgi:hypothetical protein
LDAREVQTNLIAFTGARFILSMEGFEMPITLDKALEIRSSFLSRPYEKELVQDHGDWWFFPDDVRNFSSMAMFIDKADGHFHAVRRHLLSDQLFWAYRRGFKHDVYDLEITEVYDVPATIAFLCGRLGPGLGRKFTSDDINRQLVFEPGPATKSGKLKEPLSIKNMWGLWSFEGDFYSFEPHPPFAYSLKCRSCPSPGCSEEDSKFSLPAQRTDLMNVSLREFLTEARLGEISHGATRAEVGRILGEPDPSQTRNRRLNPVWQYDHLKFDFDDNRVKFYGLAASPHFQLPPFLHFTDIDFARSLTLDILRTFARKEAIPFEEGQKNELCFRSGVRAVYHGFGEGCSVMWQWPP